ncbi:hypothetical protein J2741_001189 [Methanolinea mesophila]|uniref:hypothetical protein n=1 Tax=Methanolinea mesophila TaxID=547055 RepID=UPI001AE7A768|nr:hypothetical protein [Methanolinea mesophila]MBP1928642.1 hypothetical protein [Methanolinea mesophila]
MDLLVDAVKKLEETAKGSGCEDGTVVLRVDPERKYCQYERGACMEAVFAGRAAEFVTDNPTRATTRAGFMFGAALEKPAQRAAAAAITNALAGFFCISRVMRSCDPDCHARCLAGLREEIGASSVFVLGDCGVLSGEHERHRIRHAGDADRVLVTGEGMIAPGAGDLLEASGNTGRVLFLGPSTAGVAALENIPHWCPFGQR